MTVVTLTSWTFSFITLLGHVKLMTVYLLSRYNLIIMIFIDDVITPTMVRKIPFMRVYALTKFALGQIARKLMIGLTQPGIKYNPRNFCFFEAIVRECISISIVDIQKLREKIDFEKSVKT